MMGWDARYAGRLEGIQPSAIMPLLKIETLRLNFGTPSDAVIPEGIGRLAEAIRDLTA